MRGHKFCILTNAITLLLCLAVSAYAATLVADAHAKKADGRWQALSVDANGYLNVHSN